MAIEKPLLIEGPAGAGKTEIGKVLAETLQTELVRLQCYEGLDEAKALYEWNYQKQLLRIQADRASDLEWSEVTQHIFSRDYLLRAPAPPRHHRTAQGRAADRRGRQGR